MDEPQLQIPPDLEPLLSRAAAYLRARNPGVASPRVECLLQRNTLELIRAYVAAEDRLRELAARDADRALERRLDATG